MKTETKELHLPCDTSPETCRQIVGEEKKDGWNIQGSRTEIVLTFRREVPDPPAEQQCLDFEGRQPVEPPEDRGLQGS